MKIKNSYSKKKFNFKKLITELKTMVIYIVLVIFVSPFYFPYISKKKYIIIKKRVIKHHRKKNQTYSADQIKPVHNVQNDDSCSKHWFIFLWFWLLKLFSLLYNEFPTHPIYTHKKNVFNMPWHLITITLYANQHTNWKTNTTLRLFSFPHIFHFSEKMMSLRY